MGKTLQSVQISIKIEVRILFLLLQERFSSISMLLDCYSKQLYLSDQINQHNSDKKNNMIL